MEEVYGHKGTAKLAEVLSRRIKKENDSPLILDFGEIQANGSLLTNTFPVPIPKGDYSVCRQLTLGGKDDKFTLTDGEGPHDYEMPEKMKSIEAGDRVLVAWVQNEAVVIDIIEQS